MINLKSFQTFKRPLLGALLCAGVALCLQGCVELAVGSAVIGTLSASTDRRTFGAQAEDKTIVVKGEGRVAKLVGESGHVNLNSFNRRVLLTGEVRDQQTKDAVEGEVAAIEGVSAVINELDISMTTSFTSRSSDTIITGKVKAALVDTKDIFANSFKVVTERGVVYLLGRVSQREGASAAEAARGVGGVLKVVKVHEYIGEDEVKKLSNQ